MLPSMWGYKLWNYRQKVIVEFVSDFNLFDHQTFIFYSVSRPAKSGFNSINDIRVNFKVDNVYPQIRRKYFTMIDWFSFVGGFLGLFFGFSFLSGFEIMFHVFRGFQKKSKTKKLLKVKNSWIKESKMIQKIKKAQKYLSCFLRSSSIHGFSYIGDEDLSAINRYKFWNYFCNF